VHGLAEREKREKREEKEEKLYCGVASNTFEVQGHISLIQRLQTQLRKTATH